MRTTNAYDELLVQATTGSMPTDEQIEALDLPPRMSRRAFTEQATETLMSIVDRRDGGEHAIARRLARQARDEYADAFGTDKPPSNAVTEPAIDTTDPAALAAAIPRR